MQWRILSQQKPSRRARSSFARGNVASCLVAQLYLIHSAQVGNTLNIHLEQGSMQFEVVCPLEDKNIVQTFLLVLRQLCLQAGPPSWSILRPIELLQSRGRIQVQGRQTFWMVVTQFGQVVAMDSPEKGFLISRNLYFRQPKLFLSCFHSFCLPQALHRACSHFDACTLDSN